MTSQKLKDEFDKIGATPKDFIDWAASYGVKVTNGVCQRHLGKYAKENPRKINEGFHLAYLIFFENYK